jgi:hypothetical protein
LVNRNQIIKEIIASLLRNNMTPKYGNPLLRISIEDGRGGRAIVVMRLRSQGPFEFSYAMSQSASGRWPIHNFLPNLFLEKFFNVFVIIIFL